jgi:hypothetical protein
VKDRVFTASLAASMIKVKLPYIGEATLMPASGGGTIKLELTRMIFANQTAMIAAASMGGGLDASLVEMAANNGLRRQNAGEAAELQQVTEEDQQSAGAIIREADDRIAMEAAFDMKSAQLNATKAPDDPRKTRFTSIKLSFSTQPSTSEFAFMRHKVVLLKHLLTPMPSDTTVAIKLQAPTPGSDAQPELLGITQ